MHYLALPLSRTGLLGLGVRLLCRTVRLVGSGAGLAAAAAAVLVVTATAAWGDSPTPAVCRSLFHGNPPGSLAVTADVPAGTRLRPGDTVHVTATWSTADWPGPELHKVLHCVSVDGVVDHERSTQEKPTPNDGAFSYSFTVPPGARSEVCDRARLSGRLVPGADLTVQKSNPICFEIAADPSVPVAGVTVPEAPARTVSGAGTAAPAPETAPRPTPVPTAVAGAPPSPDPAAGFDVLPRTGSGVSPAVGTGLVSLLFGSALLVASRRRPQPRGGTPSPKPAS